MTFQEILDGITAHRANPMPAEGFNPAEVRRKLDEIEWAVLEPSGNISFIKRS